MTEDVEDFLAHYGVLGMKWGVRKDDKTSKSPTPVKDKDKSKFRVRAEAGYRKRGYSVAESERRAVNKARAVKILAVVGGVAVAGLAGHAVHKEIGKRFTEINLPAGTAMQNINLHGPDLVTDRRMYVSFEDADTNKYRGLMYTHLKKQAFGREIYNTTLKATENIKAPSHSQAAKLFKEYAKSGGDIRGLPMSSYSQFNTTLVLNDKVTNSFTDFVKSKGYNALLDANDQFVSGFDAKKPLILLNAKSSTIKSGEEAINQFLGRKQANVENAKMNTRLLLTSAAPLVGLGAVAIGSAKAFDTHSRYGAINSYMKANPDSKVPYSDLFNSAKVNKDGTWSISAPKLKS